MSIQIKSLTVGAPIKDTSPAALADTFNTIPTANEFYDLYTASNETTDRRSTIVKSIRLINTHATLPAQIALYFNRPNASGQSRRRLLLPENMNLAPNCAYVDDAEVTLEPGDKIQAKTDVAGVIQYVISGVEREMS